MGAVGTPSRSVAPPEERQAAGRREATAPTAASAPAAVAIDRVLPGQGSWLDRASARSHGALHRLAATPVGRVARWALRGNDWAGHPAHPAMVVAPIGAWLVSAWFDARGSGSGDPRDEYAADRALKLGLASAGVAAATGVAQYLDTGGPTRRETALHAMLNSASTALYLGSWHARRTGRRAAGRRLALAGLAGVAVSGYLGGDLAYRHGVGVARQ